MVMEKIIDNFNGNFSFLSNFSQHSFCDIISGVKWLTVEHYYQAMKTVNMVDRGRIWSALTPATAKELGQKVEIRDNWNVIKYDIMKYAVECKFEQNQQIKKLLIDTAEYNLIEGNWWHDNIWGDCRCSKCKNITGLNMLGKILVLTRQRFIDRNCKFCG